MQGLYEMQANIQLGNLSVAKTLMVEMKISKSTWPDITTYNTLLSGLVGANDVMGYLKLLTEMKERMMVPDLNTKRILSRIPPEIRERLRQKTQRK